VAAPLALSACVTARDPIVTTAAPVRAGNWVVDRQIDRITGAPLSLAYVVTRNSSYSSVAFTHPARMELGCFRQQPIVRFVFSYKVGSNRNSMLSYRFDDRPGRETKARFLHLTRMVVIEDEDAAAQFLRELAASKTLYILVRSLNAGRSSAEFNVEGASAAIEQALADCAPKGAGKSRRAEARPAN
jgi:hypothetical protein